MATVGVRSLRLRQLHALSSSFQTPRALSTKFSLCSGFARARPSNHDRLEHGSPVVDVRHGGLNWCVVVVEVVGHGSNQRADIVV